MALWSVLPITKLALAVNDVGEEQAHVGSFRRLAHRVRQRRPLDGRSAFVVLLCCLTLGGCYVPREYAIAKGGPGGSSGCQGIGAEECSAGRHRASHDLGCDESYVNARYIDTVPGMVVASGCSQRALYMSVPNEGLWLVSREQTAPPKW